MSATLAALAMWCWPARSAVIRRAVPGRTFRRFGIHTWIFGPGRPELMGLAVGGSAAALTGVATGVSVGLLVTTILRLVKAAREVRLARRDDAQILACVRSLGRELRSGAPPDLAVRSTAAGHPGAGGALMTAVSSVIMVDQVSDRLRAPPTGSARWAGSRATRRSPAGRSAAGRSATSDPGSAARDRVVERLASGWALSARHGVPWAALIDALALDLAEQIRLAAARDAQVAGPRFSGYVLAAMPGFGVLLGLGMGADPVHVLFGTGAGGVMLLVGVSLTCMGLRWTDRIVRG